MANPSPNPDQAEFYAAPMIVQLREFLSQHRRALAHCLEGVTETEARVRLVPSKTTLLGLVKHATFVEQVWFQEARTGTPRAELGIAGTPDASFDLAETDTIESVLRGYGKAIKASDQALDGGAIGRRLVGQPPGRPHRLVDPSPCPSRARSAPGARGDPPRADP